MDLGQFAAAIAEEEGEALWNGALVLHQKPVGEGFGEGPEHDVIRQEMGVSRLGDVVDMEGVAPDGVLSDIGLAGRHDDFGTESQLFALLREEVVGIDILKGVSAVRARCHAFDDEASLLVGACHTEHGQGGESGVGKVVIESHEDTLDGFEGLGIDDIACHFQRVDHITGGETVGVVAHRVALVVVGDSIGEIHRVGGVGDQRVLDFHGDTIAGSLDLGGFQLRGRDDHFLGGVVEFDILVEEDGDLPAAHGGGEFFRIGGHDMRWGIIIPSAVGLPHSGATCQQ